MLKRQFYRLSDLADRWNCAVTDLLHLGIQDQAQVCVNIYGLAPTVHRVRLEESDDTDYEIDDRDREEADIHNAAFERWKARTTVDMPHGVFEVLHDDLRFLDMPNACPYELSEALKFDCGWWECEFDPPVPIHLEHLCMLHEEVMRVDREIFGDSARAELEARQPRPHKKGPRMSDPRLKVIAALIENADINLSEKLGQAAALKRLVDATGYGPVSADLCESMVKAIKDRMSDWD